MAEERKRGAERATGIQIKLMEYFEHSEGKVVYLGALSTALGYDETACQRGVNNLRRKIESEGGELRVVMRGQAWKYIRDARPKDGVVMKPGAVGGVVIDRSQPANGQSLSFAYVGASREGDLILQSADGRLFRAKEL